MHFYVLGLNHKECPIEVRERLHFTPSQLVAALEAAKERTAFEELVILSTCNRVEFYLTSPVDMLPESHVLALVEKTHGIASANFGRYLYCYQDEQVFRHLFRVAAGLDSLVVGENEILGQLRYAFRQASAVGTVHSLLYRLMEKALKVGKDVRSQTRINQGAVSIPSVAVELAEKIFGHLIDQNVMVMGTGEMAELTLKALKGAGAEAFCIVSRSRERGERLAKGFGGEWVSMEHWTEKLVGADILIASTAAPHPIIGVETIRQVMLLRKHRPLFLIDIAVPRNIEAAVNTIDDVYLYNLDDLKEVAAANLRLRKREIHAAEECVEQAITAFKSWLAQLEARPTLDRLEKRLNALLEQELERAFAGQAAGDKIRELRDRIRAKLLHAPHQRIKEASRNGGVKRYLEALHSLFNLDDKES